MFHFRNNFISNKDRLKYGKGNWLNLIIDRVDSDGSLHGIFLDCKIKLLFRIKKKLKREMKRENSK